MGYVWPLQFSDQAGNDWRGEHRPELLDLVELFRHLTQLPDSGELSAESWRGALPPHAVFVRSLGPETAQLVLRGGSLTDIVVKAASPEPVAWWRLSGAHRRSRAFRAFQWAHRLRAFGLEAPRPLGYLERSRAPSRHRSFQVSEHVEALSLLALAEERLTPVVEQGPRGLLEKRARLWALGRVLADLERLGVALEELHPGQLAWTGEAWCPVGIDPPDRRGGPVGEGLEHFLERLGQAPRHTRTDQLRVLAAYHQRAGGSVLGRRRLGVRASPAVAAAE